ncbi:MAG: ribbon-helix-helix protein, CopG family [Candidatus Heimdallarchaeota archaeon]|nr:ribbon-helix-helix protein, CopG family [Candidatus Heimdallarchaeota archaeon]
MTEQMYKHLVKLSKKLGYLNKSEHMRELIRYELETYADMIKHKVIK